MTKLQYFIHLYEGKIRDLQVDSAAYGLWAGLQVSVQRMRYLWNTRTWRSLRRYAVQRGPGKVFKW
jgi:hypothetical protein